MKLIVSLIISVIVNFFCIAQSSAANETMLLRIEKSRTSDDVTEPEAATIGAFSVSPGKVGHFDLIYFQSDIEGDIWGLDFGLGYTFSSKPSPLIMYLGFGLMLGYNSDQSEFKTGYYPEAGVVYTIKQGVGITATAKRYFNVYDDDIDVVMIGIALSY